MRARLGLLLLLSSAALMPASAHETEAASEPALRAALVFNFLKFTEWPAAFIADGKLTLCVASGDHELLAAMEALNHRSIRDLAVEVIPFRQPTGCKVIYVDAKQRWNRILEKSLAPRTLTLGGYAGFAADGGMIEIALSDGSPRFDINQAEAKRAGLRFYPQLLRLARRVVE